jgi:hypothetical protein
MTKLYENIKDGVLLCKILNVLHPGAVPGDSEGSSKMHALENLSKFAGAAAEIYGVDRKYMFRVLDFYSLTESGTEGMTIFLAALAIKASEKGFTVNFPVGEAKDLLEACQNESVTAANYNKVKTNDISIACSSPSSQNSPVLPLVSRSSTLTSIRTRQNTATSVSISKYGASASANMIGSVSEITGHSSTSINDIPSPGIASSDERLEQRVERFDQKRQPPGGVLGRAMSKETKQLTMKHQLPGSTPNISSTAPLLSLERTHSRMKSSNPSSPQLNVVDVKMSTEPGNEALVKLQQKLEKLARMQKLVQDKVDLAIKTSPGKAGERFNANHVLLTQKMANCDMAQRELLNVFLESFLAGTGVDYDGEYVGSDSMEELQIKPDANPSPTKSAFAGKLPPEVIAANLPKQEMIRLSVIYEMIETEQDFARDLTVMITVYISLTNI